MAFVMSVEYLKGVNPFFLALLATLFTRGVTALGVAGVMISAGYRSLRKQAEIAGAMALEALMANMKPYDARLHKLRGSQGAVTAMGF